MRLAAFMRWFQNPGHDGRRSHRQAGRVDSSDSPGETFYKGAAGRISWRARYGCILPRLQRRRGDSERNAEAVRQLLEARKRTQTLAQQVDDLAARCRDAPEARSPASGTGRGAAPARGASLSLAKAACVCWPSTTGCRDAQRYRPRADDAVRHIVIHDTGAPAGTSLESWRSLRMAGPALIFVIDMA